MTVQAYNCQIFGIVIPGIAVDVMKLDVEMAYVAYATSMQIVR